MYLHAQAVGARIYAFGFAYVHKALTPVRHAWLLMKFWIRKVPACYVFTRHTRDTPKQATPFDQTILFAKAYARDTYVTYTYMHM